MWAGQALPQEARLGTSRRQAGPTPFNLEPETQNPKTEIRHLRPETRNLKFETRIPNPESRNSKSETRSPKIETRKLKDSPTPTVPAIGTGVRIFPHAIQDARDCRRMRCLLTYAIARTAYGARDDFISHTVFINYFQKFNSPTKPSTKYFD